MTMNRRPKLALGLSVSMLATVLAFTDAAASNAWPRRWQVNGNGITGVLEFEFREDGSLIGRLLDEYVEGYVSGRRLVIRRSTDDREEVWEGWLGEPRLGAARAGNSGSNLIVAGTISVDEAGQTRVYPWFGTPEGASSAPASSPSPASSPASSSSPTPRPAAEALATMPPPADGPLSGTWTSVTGERLEIAQDGNRLTVTRSDGSSHSGRMTGSSTLVVGLRTGCCNGELDGPNAIVWSDGVRWHRQVD
jgi:hypothetical protein